MHIGIQKQLQTPNETQCETAATPARIWVDNIKARRLIFIIIHFKALEVKSVRSLNTKKSQNHLKWLSLKWVEFAFQKVQQIFVKIRTVNKNETILLPVNLLPCRPRSCRSFSSPSCLHRWWPQRGLLRKFSNKFYACPRQLSFKVSQTS